ncbi:hypothetical protein CR513_62554, partial [Mucuna pruriens]
MIISHDTKQGVVHLILIKRFRVYLGDDKACAVGRKIKIQIYDGVVRMLCEIRHIPDPRNSLISQGGIAFIELDDDITKLWCIYKLDLCKFCVIRKQSKKVWVYFLKHKFEVFTKFKLWKVEMENQTGRKIKYLRSGNCIEYTDLQFQKFSKEYDIHRYFSICKIPQ